MRVTKAMLHDENRRMDIRIIRLKNELKRRDRQLGDVQKECLKLDKVCHDLINSKENLENDNEELRRKALNDHLMVDMLNKELDAVSKDREVLHNSQAKIVERSDRVFNMLEAVILRKEPAK